MDLVAGAAGLRNGQIKNPVTIAASKYYVVGRARYHAFDIEPNDDVDVRNVLPLSAQDFYYSLRQYLNDDERWTTFKELFQEDNADEDQDVFFQFVNKLWSPTVKDLLESHSGLIPDEHNPQLTTGGSISFDIKVMKLMKRKFNTNEDINADISRARAVEVLQILRSKFAGWPQAFLQVIFRGPNNRGIEGLDPDSEPFFKSSDDAYAYLPNYTDEEGNGPILKAIRPEGDWGLILCIVKPDSQELFEESEYGNGAQDAMLEGGFQGGLIGGPSSGGSNKDSYGLLKGPQKTNRFGNRNDLMHLEWRCKYLGLQEMHGNILIRAYKWNKTTEQCVIDLFNEHKTLFVFVPPRGQGRSDGYYSNNEEDYALMKPWIQYFNATALWGPQRPLLAEDIFVWKALLFNQPKHKSDLADWGLRGGHLLEIKML